MTCLMSTKYRDNLFSLDRQIPHEQQRLFSKLKSLKHIHLFFLFVHVLCNNIFKHYCSHLRIYNARTDAENSIAFTYRASHKLQYRIWRFIEGTHSWNYLLFCRYVFFFELSWWNYLLCMFLESLCLLLADRVKYFMYFSQMSSCEAIAGARNCAKF